VRCQLDNLSRIKAQFLVVIQDGVHVLNPDSIYRSIKHNPVLVSCLIFDAIEHNFHKDSVSPFLSRGVGKAIHLVLGNRFGVQTIYMHFLVMLCLTESRKSVLQDFIIASFTCSSWSHYHETMSNYSSIVQLKRFCDEMLNVLQVELFASLTYLFNETIVFLFGPINSREEINYDILK
jgi:hypothetical protein